MNKLLHRRGRGERGDVGRRRQVLWTATMAFVFLLINIDFKLLGNGLRRVIRYLPDSLRSLRTLR